MPVVAILAGSIVIAVILWDGFEAVVLPRRVARRVRLLRYYYRAVWPLWAALGRRIKAEGKRENFLGFFGPLSLLGLLGLWAVGLVLGFALLQWGFGSDLVAPTGAVGFVEVLYMSGTTFVTLGLGDITPTDNAARAVTVLEAGTGFGFLALVISYVPVLYQSFSRREVHVALLDARAGSPPKALTLLRRCSEANDFAELARQLAQWEEWCAELLESHLSYPVLAWYRSQHEHQSWLASLTLILDVSALLLAGGRHELQRGARLTFAMARHAAVDLAQAFSSPDDPKGEARLDEIDARRLHELMSAIPVLNRYDRGCEPRLVTLRGTYEPYVSLLASYLLMPLPDWLPADGETDDWMTSAWETSALRLPELE